MKYLTNYVPQGGGMSDGYVAVEENGELKLQKLSFSGTEAAPEGATEAMLEVGLFPTGMEEPAYAGSGGGGGGGSAMKFYQCTAVDTATKTWTGKELILQDGKYTVSSDITTGLTYTTMTPVENYIYSEDALIRVGLYYTGMPTDGLVFYASLNGKTPDVAETGQTLTLKKQNDSNFNWTYMVEDGISCVSSADADGSDARDWSGLEFDASTLPMGSSPRTVSLWVKLYNSSNGGFFAYGNYSRGNTFTLYYASNYNAIKFSCHGDDVYSTTGYNLDTWRHIAITLDGTTNKSLKFYVDGVQKETVVTQEIGINTSGSICRIGCGSMAGYGRFDGWLSSIRVYDRALSQEEITTLANEFTPTTA